MPTNIWCPHATVATIVEKDNYFLLVEEIAGGKKVFNQPAGHLEQNETLFDAAIRETLEETGWHVELTDVTGFYTYLAPTNGITYHRTCFAANPINLDTNATLDEGIVGAVWLTYEELKSQRNKLRSPLVLRCIEDYLADKRYPLDIIYHHQ